MTDYEKWNDLIGSYFFNENKDGHSVLLYITKEQLINLYRNTYSDYTTDNDIWNFFIETLNCPKVTIEDGSQRRYADCSPKDLARLLKCLCRLTNYRETSEYIELYDSDEHPVYPIYLTFLALLVMAKAHKAGETDANVYDAITSFFEEHKIIWLQDTCAGDVVQSTLKEGDRETGHYWRKLELWSQSHNLGEFKSFFEPNVRNHPRFAAVIRTQCVLSQTVKDRLPAFFENAILRKEIDYPLEVFRNKMLYRSNYFSDSIINIVKNDGEWRPIVEVVYNYFRYDWHPAEVVVGTFSGRKLNLPLYYCVSVNGGTRSFDVHYRIHTIGAFPYQLEARVGSDKTIIEEQDCGWSKSISGVPSSIGNVSFNLDKDAVIILHRNDLLGEFVSEKSIINSSGRLLFLCKNDIWKEITNNRINVVDSQLYNEKGWRLGSYQLARNIEFDPFLHYLSSKNGSFKDSKDWIVKKGNLSVTLKSDFQIGETDGIPEYLPSLLPEIEVNDSDTIELKNSNGESRQLIKVEQNFSSSFKWRIFSSSLPAGDYKIKKYLDGKVLKDFRVIEQKALDVDYDDIDRSHPLFDMSGRVVRKKDKYYRSVFIDNEILPSRDHYINGHQFKAAVLNHDISVGKNGSIYNPNNGDKLVEWLYYKGSCSLEEFAMAASTLRRNLLEGYKYTEEQNQKLIKECNDINRLVDNYINWGILAKNRNNRIVACRPRFLLVPTPKGVANKVVLLGCLSTYAINTIKNVCAQRDINMNFMCEQSLNKPLQWNLCPSKIFIEFSGPIKSNSGLDDLMEKIGNPYLIKEPDLAYYDKLINLMPNLSTFESEPEEMEQRWMQCTCEIFNPDPKVYEYQNNNRTLQEEIEVAKEQGKCNILVKFKDSYEFENILVNISTVTCHKVRFYEFGKLYMLYQWISSQISSSYKLLNGYQVVHDRNKGIWNYQPFFTRLVGADGKSSDKLAVSAKCHLPALLEKYMTYISSFTPTFCNAFEDCRKKCKLHPKDEQEGPCDSSQKNCCQHKYILYDVNDSRYDIEKIKKLFFKFGFNFFETIDRNVKRLNR